jgi:hypothetical protein
MRPLYVVLILGALVVVGAGGLYMMTEGAMFSRGHHDWRVVVEPDGGGAWALFVPRIMASDGDTGEPLDAMLSTLAVTEAGFALDHMRMRIDGEGRAVLVARSEFSGMGPVGEREAFSHWRVTNLSLMHAGGPPLDVTWAVDFSGGEGHTCWSSATYRARVEGNATADLMADAATGPPGDAMRPWPVLCA